MILRNSWGHFEEAVKIIINKNKEIPTCPFSRHNAEKVWVRHKLLQAEHKGRNLKQRFKQLRRFKQLQ